MPKKSSSDEQSIVGKEFRTPRGRLIFEKRGKTIRYQYIPYEDGKLASDYDNIESIPTGYIDRFIEKLYKPKRERRYLKREDWADPDQAFNAEINQSAKKLTPRVSPDHLRAFEEAAAKFPDKRAALERALELLATETGVKKPKPSLKR
jgi:hypothetical protein